LIPDDRIVRSSEISFRNDAQTQILGSEKLQINMRISFANLFIAGNDSNGQKCTCL